MKPVRIIAIALIFLGFFFLWKGATLVGYYLGAARFKHVPLEAGSIQIPQERTTVWRERSALTEDILEYWASQKLRDWPEGGKTKMPRLILAKLVLKRDIEDVNTHLLNQVPGGRSGSTWRFHKKGDYDFTLAGLTLILYLFGDKPELLFPQTRQHLLTTLLIEEGGKPRISVPRSFGLVRDTENHLLMTEGSRYLKNRWLALHGNTDSRYNNEENGLEEWILSLLGELHEAGLYEFNSIPYLGFTLTALMNLEAFGSDTVRQAARTILDRLNWEYALGSLSLRRFAPFRRQLRNAGITSLNSDCHTTLMKVWMSLKQETSLDLTLTEGFNHALRACLLHYRPADKVADWVERKPTTYFVKIGHGPDASPEIYSGGPEYLISAGGIHRGWRSLIVARPITLMLDDNARYLEQVIHLAGPGDEFSEWNNTGVYKDFACAAGPVHVPKDWVVVAQNNLWAVYQRTNFLSLAVHSRENLGIICLSHEKDAEKVFQEITKVNSDAETLYLEFQRPQGKLITYDVKAPKNRWVIVSVGRQKMDRNFDRWPRLDGEMTN